MKRFLKWSGMGVGALVLAAGLLFANFWFFKPLSIEWYYSRVFLQFSLQQPELMTSLRFLDQFGIRDHHGELTDRSIEAERARRDWWKEQYAVFQRYDRADYEGQDRLSYDIFDFYAHGTVERAARWRLHNFPVNQMFGVQSTLPDLMVQQHVIEDELGAEHYIARLTQFDQAFSDVLDGLREREEAGIVPPSITVSKVIDQVDGFLEPAPADHLLVTSFDERVAEIDASELSVARRQELRAAVVDAVTNVVYPAYGELRDYLADLQAVATSNDGVWRLPDGEAFYQSAIREHTTTDMTADEVHALGLAEVSRIGAEMDDILRGEGLTEGTIGERMRQIAERPDQLYPDSDAGRSRILADYQDIIDEIDVDMPQYFNLRPDVGVEVVRVPEFSQATAPPAYYQAPSLDGERPGRFFANLRDVKEVPRFSMRTLAYHEAIPGHHFQLAITQQIDGLPLFRRLVPFTAYSEGWALYAEQLAWEAGFQDDPLDNLGRLQFEMWRAVRLVVDTGLHHKRWSRERAIDYMDTWTGLGRKDIVSEIDRYLVIPGQALAYKVGMIEILELRERAREALGQDFDLKAFHDQVLGNGAVPLVILERIVDDWIARTGDAPR